jgi:hypothetical protein
MKPEPSFTDARGLIGDAKDVLILVDGLLKLWETDRPGAGPPPPQVNFEGEGRTLTVHLHWGHPSGDDVPAFWFSIEATADRPKPIRWSLMRCGEEIEPGQYKLATDRGTGVKDGLAVLHRMLREKS